jgi:hypothetical protein
MDGTHYSVCPKLAVFYAELRSEQVPRREGIKKFVQLMDSVRRDLHQRFCQEVFYDYKDVVTCVSATCSTIFLWTGYRGV